MLLSCAGNPDVDTLVNIDRIAERAAPSAHGHIQIIRCAPVPRDLDDRLLLQPHWYVTQW